MNTNDVYLASLNVVTNIEVEPVAFYGNLTTVKSKGMKFVLVESKKNIFGKLIMKDLNTNEKYTLKVPSKIGKIFIPTKGLTPLNSYYNDLELDIPKEKIKKIGNKAINELYSRVNEEE